MASPGSLLPEGYVLGAMSHADRIGIVYEAASPDGARAVSAQVLHPLHVDELREWFEANARLGAMLEHPNLVSVLAVGETHNGLPVAVTERVEGRTLRARIASGDLHIGGDLLRVLRAVASALDYLHAQRPTVLHRALTPEHVVCTAGGAVKLVAVGHADCPRFSPTKPAYLSPEELCDGPTSPASDVFSFASLAYELITGRPAFAGSAEAVVAAARRGMLPHVGVVPSDVFLPVNRVLHRAWVFSPRERTAKAGVFAAELEDALRLVPNAQLALRRAHRDGGSRPPPRSSPTGAHRMASQPPPGRVPTRPAMTVSARRLTPYPSVPVPSQGSAAIYSLPPPPRVPSIFPAAIEEREPEPASPPSPRAREITPSDIRRLPAAPEPPAPQEPPATYEAPRTLVDTDDAVLILEPALIDAAELPPQDDALPPLVSVVPPAEEEEDAPEVEIRDDEEPVEAAQRAVLLEKRKPVSPEAVVSSVTSSALALSSREPLAPPVVDDTPFASPPSWSRWRPTMPARISDRPWHGRELRFTPRMLVLILAVNVLVTALVVGLIVVLARR